MVLHVDSCAKLEGFLMTECYLISRFGESDNAEIRLDDAETFSDLVKEGIVGEGMYIRTSCGGIDDRCYRILADGELFGEDFGVYSAEERVYSAEEALSERNIESGYVIYGKSFSRNFGEWFNKKFC